MKYIIDIEDEYTKDWVNETPMCKELCMPISVPNRQRTYHVSTGFKLEPYTEPDRKTIEDEVWEFARKMISTSGNEVSEMWGCATNFGEVMHNTTYSEAKAKYEEWKKSKDEIRVGDEVELSEGVKGLVYIVGEEMLEGAYLNCDGLVPFCWRKEDCRKTGKHFDEIAELLKKMRDAE